MRQVCNFALATAMSQRSIQAGIIDELTPRLKLMYVVKSVV